MAPVDELLLKILDDLDSKKLHRFKWLLKKNHASISTADTENAEATGVVDIMVARFTSAGAVKVMLDILRKMNENHLAEQLENEYKDVGSAVQTSRDAHTVDLNLQSGEVVNAPVLSSPVTVPSSSGGVEQQPCSAENKLRMPVFKSFSLTAQSAEKKLRFPVLRSFPLQSINGQDLEIKQYACNLKLDPNTAHPNLFLSERNRKATHVREKQPYPDHPERFDWQPQVLCGESLAGRCYWEVEWSTRMWVEIAVTYKGTRYKGADNDFLFSRNARSWVLKCSRYQYLAYHNNHMTNIPAPSQSKRAGVYVDVSAGTLSFYSVSDTHTLTHLHTFNTTFTEPLYAGFLLQSDCSVSLCEI